MTKATIHNGDAVTALRRMPPKSVHCCVTSPPYWGLRDYGTDPLVWGGDPECNHDWVEHVQPAANGIVHDGGMSGETLSGRSATRRPKRSDFCRCGAWRGCLGLEPTPQLFVAHLVMVFAEVWRVLRDDGTLWLNLGDSYASGKGSCFNPGGGETSFKDRRKEAGVMNLNRLNKSDLEAVNLKPKDLVGIPWMTAFALRDAGWYLRSDIIWAKPNPMPESVRDRPTKAHEYLFLLSKRERYYFDGEAIKEESTQDERRPTFRGGAYVNNETFDNGNGGKSTDTGNVRLPRDPGPREPRPGIDSHGGNQANGQIPNVSLYRNRRSVWEIATEPYSEAHFATFPTRLVEPCILAGSSSRGCCPDCGAPWERQTTSTRKATRPAAKTKLADGKAIVHRVHHGKEVGNRDPERHISETVTTGWGPGCKCDAGEPVACRVLDPFAGACTTAVVALRLGRDFIGAELNREYAEMGRRRIRDDQPLLSSVEVV